MIEIEAIDLFVESDPTGGEDEEADSLICVRVPADRDFARQIKELGARWDDASKEWRIVGGEKTIQQIGTLCKAAFPQLPRRRNRLVVAQLSTAEGNSWSGSNDSGGEGSQKEEEKPQSNDVRQVELITRVEFVVNRTLKSYRRGQNLKWHREFREIVELSASEAQASAGEDRASEEAQAQYVSRLRSAIRELEQAATEAFEALLLGRKEAVGAILKQAGLEQV